MHKQTRINPAIFKTYRNYQLNAATWCIAWHSFIMSLLVNVIRVSAPLAIVSLHDSPYWFCTVMLHSDWLRAPSSLSYCAVNHVFFAQVDWVPAQFWNWWKTCRINALVIAWIFLNNSVSILMWCLIMSELKCNIHS